MGQKGFKDLTVWRKAKDLAVIVYKLSGGAKHMDLGLRDQLRRSAVSIASNLAEGDERDTDKESIRFFVIAKGSAAEIRTPIQIAFETGYVPANMYETLDADYDILAKMIGKLIQTRRRTSRLLPLAPRQ